MQKVTATNSLVHRSILMLSFQQASALVNKQIFSRWINFRCVSSTTNLNKSIDMVDQPDQSLPIPQYKHKDNESLELRKARLVLEVTERSNMKILSITD